MSRFIFLAVFIVAGVGITYYYIAPKEKPLPIINPVDVDPEMVDQDLLRVGMGHKIGNFNFENQLGKTITQQEVSGKVYVAEYFFTTCKSICPIMNKEMQRVYKVYKNDPSFRILSFTVDPDVDTVEQMNRYALEHGVSDDESWHFLTGKKDELYQLARKSFFVLKPAEALNQGDAGSDFIHTNNFVLVDRQGRIRGYYDGTASEEVSQLIIDIEHVMKE